VSVVAHRFMKSLLVAGDGMTGLAEGSRTFLRAGESGKDE
jgi:hypothetical protein